jgi:hypothetical protein
MREVRLVARAIRQEWPITPEARQRAIDRVMSILDSTESETRALRCVQTLVAADSVNVKREGNDVAEVDAQLSASAAAMQAALNAHPEVLEALLGGPPPEMPPTQSKPLDPPHNPAGLPHDGDAMPPTSGT